MPMCPGPDSTGGATRRAFLAAAAGGITLGGGPLVEAARAGEQPDGSRDVAILNFALGLEYLQAAFYTEAASRLRVRRLNRFAQIVAGHERAHVAYLRRALGGDAMEPPKFAFRDATRRPAAFTDASIALEDLAVQAYNGAAPALSARALAAAARVVSVDARHAAWIRTIDGRDPAAEPTDPGRPAREVAAAIDRLGFSR